MQIEVKSCGECPLRVESNRWDYCGINKDINEFCLPLTEVHENCPLKTESVTVKLKDDANNN